MKAATGPSATPDRKLNHMAAIRDFLLITFSTAVIILSQVPRGPERQLVSIRSVSGSTRTYSLPLDDRRLTELRNHPAFSVAPKVRAKLACLKWRSETAAFYADLTSPAPANVDANEHGKDHAEGTASNDAKGGTSTDVVAVSFTASAATEETSDETTESSRSMKLRLGEHEHWLRVRDQSDAALAAAETKLQQLELAATKNSAIRFGAVVQGGYGTGKLAMASAAGVIIALVFAIWAYLSPAIALASGAVLNAGPADRSAALRLEIPAKWVHIHQPLGVHARRTAYAAIVLAALATFAL